MNNEQTPTPFETLLLPLMNDAYNLARWLMRNQEDAEDMVQESYLRAFRFFRELPRRIKLPRPVSADRAQHMLHRVGRSEPETEASATGLGGR
jgi:Sigma-70 region 2